MRFRRAFIAGIPLLLILHGSSAAEQRQDYAGASTAYQPLRQGSQPNRRIATGPPTAEDRHWGTEFGLPIPNGAVTCVAIFDGDVVIGGDFTHIGGKRVGYIARWDGAQWMSLGGGVDAPVDALLPSGTDLLVGGKFRAADGTHAQGVARWDGASWSAVGSDITGSGGTFGGVRSLVMYRGELVVGGHFASASNASIQGIARLDGTTWKPLGAGIAGIVNATATFRDSLYAIGSFNSVGEVPASNIARWDGVMWSGVGRGIEFPPSAIAVYGDRLYVSGHEVGDITDPNLTAWNGTTWDHVGDARFNAVASLAVHGGKLFVGDYHGLQAWDGSQWTLADDSNGWYMAMTSNGGDLVFVGDFVSRDQRAFNVGKWDGSEIRGFERWDPSMNGMIDYRGRPIYVASLTSHKDELLTIGYLGYFGTASGWGGAYGIPVWSGSSWRPLDSTAPPFNALPTYLEGETGFGGLPRRFNGELFTLHSGGDVLYLGGQFQELALPNLPHAVIQFDGVGWSALDTLAGHASALIELNGTLYAAVSRDVNEGLYGRGPTESVLRWGGDHWEEIGLASAAGTPWRGVPPISGLGEHEGDLVVHGSLQSINGIAVNGIARWNGREWRTFGAGPRDCVWPFGTVAASLGDRLIVQTTSCSGSEFNNSRMEAWDGRSWSSVPGIQGWISSIAGIRGLLYVGGDFELYGIGSHITVATWDGLHWARLGSGLDGSPNAIVEHNGDVYFGGPISTAGGKSSFGIARWNDPPRAPPIKRPRLSQTGSNPFRASTDLSLMLDGAGTVRVSVYDLHGREIRVIEDGPRSAGPHAIHWDGRDRLGRQVPVGVYFVSARTPNGTTISRKVVRLR